MKLFYLCKVLPIFVALWSSVTFAIPTDPGAPPADRCGAVPSEEFLKFSEQEASLPAALRLKSRQTQTLNVPVYMFLIHGGPTQAEGYAAPQYVQAQFDHMQQIYAEHDINLQLQNLSYIEHPTWWNIGSTVGGGAAGQAVDLEMRTTLRQGGYDALNIYIRTPFPFAWGRCTFPEPNPSPEVRIKDGCDVYTLSLPGLTTNTQTNEGDTAVHEAGHFFGLYHTFNPDRPKFPLGRCCDATSGDPLCFCFPDPAHDDYVADTPSQCSATYYCNPNTVYDSCKGEGFEGTDPVHNFMNYGYDFCANEFTPGQRERMHMVYTTLRQGV